MFFYSDQFPRHPRALTYQDPFGMTAPCVMDDYGYAVEVEEPARDHSLFALFIE